jgi:hypothetical protein
MSKTGAPHRLNRQFGKRRGDEAYSAAYVYAVMVYWQEPANILLFRMNGQEMRSSLERFGSLHEFIGIVTLRHVRCCRRSQIPCDA